LDSPQWEIFKMIPIKSKIENDDIIQITDKNTLHPFGITFSDLKKCLIEEKIEVEIPVISDDESKTDVSKTPIIPEQQKSKSKNKKKK